jgi:biotin synthase
VHRRYNDPSMVQRCTLLSIKTGGCPENCNYCSQSTSWSKETGTKAEKLMDLDEVYEVRSCDDQHAASVPCIWLSSSAKFGVLGVSLTDSLSTLFACENGCLLGSAADQRAHQDPFPVLT